MMVFLGNAKQILATLAIAAAGVVGVRLLEEVNSDLVALVGPVLLLAVLADSMSIPEAVANPLLMGLTVVYFFACINIGLRLRRRRARHILVLLLAMAAMGLAGHLVVDAYLGF